jgi:hypothetical protein
MTLYARLCRRFPKPLVDWTFIAVEAGLLVLVVLYSDKHAAPFPYLRL